MKYVKDIPESGNYDLVVVGGGMTGFSAAVAAARKGIKTLLIESGGCLGGVATQCGVCHLLGGRKYSKQLNKHIYNVGGIFKELSEGLIASGKAVDADTIDLKRNPHGWFEPLASGLPFDSEAMKLYLDRMLSESGAELLYFTEVVDVVVSNRKIESVIINNKNGLSAIKASYFIDATGDADIAYFAGCPCVLGRDGDSLMAPASLEFHVDRVNREEFLDFLGREDGRCRKLISKLRDEGIWNFSYDIFIAVQLNDPDVFMINTVRQVGVNGVDANSLSSAMTDGRAEINELFNIMKKHIPGFENARLRATMPKVGIRETRRIIGKYTLTVEEAASGTDFEDTIGISSYGWDLPDPKKPSLQPMHEIKKPISYTRIPYRCMLPQNIDNLAVAGRCISVEREVLGPIRVMAPCMAMGQAAGLAAVVAFSDRCDFSAIDIAGLKKLLIDDGCILQIN